MPKTTFDYNVRTVMLERNVKNHSLVIFVKNGAEPFLYLFVRVMPDILC